MDDSSCISQTGTLHIEQRNRPIKCNLALCRTCACSETGRGWGGGGRGKAKIQRWIANVTVLERKVRSGERGRKCPNMVSGSLVLMPLNREW